MLVLRSAFFFAAALVVASCADSVEPVDSNPISGSGSAMRVINATSGPVSVTVDGQTLLSSIAAASVSAQLALSPGAHQVHLASSLGSSDVTVQTSTTGTTTAVALPGSGLPLIATVLPDTGSIVPAGKTKLRVAHLAQGAPPIEIWRTQPDYQTPIHIMTPFAYTATSAYLQSDPGNWEVFVTAPGSTTKLLSTGLINIPAGERRTVALLDSAGVMRFSILAQ